MDVQLVFERKVDAEEVVLISAGTPPATAEPDRLLRMRVAQEPADRVQVMDVLLDDVVA
jgi:hypothetical protein